MELVLVRLPCASVDAIDRKITNLLGMDEFCWGSFFPSILPEATIVSLGCEVYFQHNLLGVKRHLLARPSERQQLDVAAEGECAAVGRALRFFVSDFGYAYSDRQACIDARVDQIGVDERTRAATDLSDWASCG